MFLNYPTNQGSNGNPGVTNGHANSFCYTFATLATCNGNWSVTKGMRCPFVTPLLHQKFAMDFEV